MIIPLSPLQVISTAGVLIALLLAFVALATPAWQVVYAREIEQWIQSGLWLNCQTRPSGMYACTYTFSASDFSFYTSAELVNLRTPPFYAWQRTLLAVFLVGQLFAFLALISVFLSFHAQTRRFGGISFVSSLAISVFLHGGALVAFALLSQMVEYRFYHVSVSGIYEKQRGYSFYLELAALLIFMASLPLAALQLIRLHSGASGTKEDYRAGNEMLDVFEREPYPALYSPSSSLSQQQGFHTSGSTTHSILDPYEAQFAMRALPELPRPRAYR